MNRYLREINLGARAGLPYEGERGPPDRHQPGPVPPDRDHAGLRGQLPSPVGQPGAHAQLCGDRLRRRRHGHPPLPGRPARDAAGRGPLAPARRLARVRGLPAVRGVQLLFQQRTAAPRAVLDPRGPAARVPAVGRPVLISGPRRADDQPCRRPSSATAWFISTRWPTCRHRPPALHRPDIVGRLSLLFGQLGQAVAQDRGERPGDPGMAHPAVVRAMRLLEADLARDWTLTGLAAELHLAPGYLVRLFNAATGLPPMAYLAQLRAEHAAVLLLHSDEPVTSIGRTVGWPDQSKFSCLGSARWPGWARRSSRARLRARSAPPSLAVPRPGHPVRWLNSQRGAGGGCIVRRSSHGPEIRPVTCVGTVSAEGEVSWCATATPPGAGSLFHDAGLAADCAAGVGLWPWRWPARCWPPRSGRRRRPPWREMARLAGCSTRTPLRPSTSSRPRRPSCPRSTAVSCRCSAGRKPTPRRPRTGCGCWTASSTPSIAGSPGSPRRATRAARRTRPSRSSPAATRSRCSAGPRPLTTSPSSATPATSSCIGSWWPERAPGRPRRPRWPSCGRWWHRWRASRIGSSTCWPSSGRSRRPSGTASRPACARCETRSTGGSARSPPSAATGPAATESIRSAGRATSCSVPGASCRPPRQSRRATTSRRGPRRTPPGSGSCTSSTGSGSGMSGWPSSGWVPMENRGSITANHYDHVHISVF